MNLFKKYHPLIVLIYTHKNELQPLFEEQLAAARLDVYHEVDPDFSWRRQMIHTMRIAGLFPNELLVFPDAWDTVLLGTKRELMDLNLHKGITVAGAKNCWPDITRAAEFREKAVTRSPWRYLNANPMAGLGKNIRDALEWGWHRFPLEGDSLVTKGNIQVPEHFLTRLYLEGPKEFDIKIDSDCRMSQVTMSWFPEDYEIRGKRVYNRVTRSWPVFLHANGTHALPEGLEL